ncbi:MAG: PAS domain S-box protein [Chloroflexi bacterium]|nr:PAS domain S-box protein [Chloroflexota bacterium]
MGNSKTRTTTKPTRNHPGKKTPPILTVSKQYATEAKRHVHDLEQYIEQLSAQAENMAQAQRQIEESRDRYAALYDFAPVGYVTFDLRGQIREINAAGAHMLGLPESRLKAILFGNLVVKSDLRLFAAHLQRCRAALTPIKSEVHLKVHSQSQILAQLITIPVSDPSDGSLVFWTVLNDVTDREKVEQERDRLFAELRDNRDRLAQLSHALFQIQEDQRRQLASELHDEVSQNLTALGLALKLLETHIPPQAGDRWQIPLKDAQNLVVETTQRIRRVTTNLRPTALDFYGLPVALEGFIKSYQERTDLDIELKTDPRLPRLAPNAEIALFRIAQEAMTNVIKHARATEVTIILDAMPHGVRLTIADNGIGFNLIAVPYKDSHGLGLATIAERALALNGKCDIQSEPGKGTRVIVEVPR